MKADVEPDSYVSDTPLPETLPVFVDGSASKDERGKNRVGYAVTTATEVLDSGPLPTLYSAQIAELHALIKACQLYEGKQLTVWTDSQYAFSSVHHSAKIWERRGMKTSSGRPVTHASVLKELLQAIKLPSKLAVCKCKAHQNDDSPITKGNNLADKVAKEAAQRGSQTATNLFVLQPMDQSVLKQAQTSAPTKEQQVG